MLKPNKLSTWQVMLLSTGGMIGAGWLFSPYYGFHTAGLGVILSWILVALMTFIIGLSFIEVSITIPIVGGISRYIGITHNKSMSFVFLSLGWLSYVVYLPLEIQSCIQYLGFWFPDLVVIKNNLTTLSFYGLILSLLVIFLLTWFNTMAVKIVAKANSLVSIWKIFIPLLIAWILIIFFGDWDNVKFVSISHPISFEQILLAITQNGLAFAFTGFQNGLILANSANDPKKSLPYSIFTPIIVGLLLYLSLSLAFIFCLGHNTLQVGAAAPLLGLVSLFSINLIFIVLFVDAVVAPLGTANVYTTMTSRILLGLSRDFMPNSIFVRLNKNLSPAYCLWFNAIVGACFLLPFPTWVQLVDFLSSVVVFAYISGPVVLLVLRKNQQLNNTYFKVWNYKLIANIGFIFCGLLIYWSGLENLRYLLITLILIIMIYGLIIAKGELISGLRSNLVVLIFIVGILVVSYLRSLEYINFPYDNLLIILFSILMCKLFEKSCLNKDDIYQNIMHYNLENLD